MTNAPLQVEATTAGDVPPGQVDLGGERFWILADGSRKPDAIVRVSDKLVDAAVRARIAAALEFSAAMARFKAASFEELDTLLEVLALKYETTMGGKKGNVTFETLDGLFKVMIAVADRIVFGPELQVAKAIVDKLLIEWGHGAKAELQAIIQDAFRVDKEGQVNRSALLGLLRIESPDERWGRAMQAIRDSMRVEGSKRYVRFYRRPAADASWTAIPLDLAAA